MKSITEIKVVESDIDVLGHVNNSVYIQYLERARLDWYSQAGAPMAEMLPKSVATVVLKIDIYFAKEARLGDCLTIHTSPIRLGNKSFDFEQFIHNQSDEIITKATVTTVMFDTVERKSIPVIEEISRHF